MVRFGLIMRLFYQVTVLKEYCQGLHCIMYTLPAGTYDPEKHLSTAQCARHELSEEVLNAIRSSMHRARQFKFTIREVYGLHWVYCRHNFQEGNC